MKLKLFGQHQQHVLQAAQAPGAAEDSVEQDAYDDTSSPEPQLLGDPEPSQPGSVRTPSDLSQEPSAVAAAAAAGGLFVEASAGSQQLLPNLLMSEEDLLNEPGFSRASSAGSRKDLNPSSHGTSLAAEHSSGSCRAAHTSMAGSSNSSAAEGGGGCNSTPMAKALFVDACLPSTPKSCSHSNLRVMASRKSSEWQQGPGGTSGSSYGGSSMHGSRCYSNSSSWTADRAETEECVWEAAAPTAAGSGSSNSTSASQQPNLQWPSGSRSAATDITAGCSVSSRGSHSNSISKSSFAASDNTTTAAPAAADDEKAEDEDLLLADMDVCLGNLQAAVQLARSASSGGQRSISGMSSNGGPSSPSSSSAAGGGGGGVHWSLSSSGRRADAAVEPGHGTAAASTRQMQRNKSRLSSGQLEAPAVSHMPANSHQLRAQPPTDTPVLLKVGRRGRPVALSQGGTANTVSGDAVSIYSTELGAQQLQQQQYVHVERQGDCEAPTCPQQQQQLGYGVEGRSKHSSLAGTAVAAAAVTTAAASQLGMPRSRLSEGDLPRLQWQQQQAADRSLLQQQRSRPQLHRQQHQQQQEKQKQQRMQSAYGTAADGGSKAKRHDGLLGWFMRQEKHNRTAPTAAGADETEGAGRREASSAHSSREAEKPKWSPQSTTDAVEPWTASETQPPQQQQQQQQSLCGDLAMLQATAPTYARGSSHGGCSRDAAELQRLGSSSSSDSDCSDSSAAEALAMPRAPFAPQPPSSSRRAAVGPAPRRLQVAGQAGL